MYMYRERVKFLGEKKFYLYRNECVHHAAMTSDLYRLPSIIIMWYPNFVLMGGSV